ncbi:hypothetical protein J2Z21_002817 [Streptomyces griseochromogenes]|uniref:Uncharacterized protein n=1 Tax=Streptomyces griseochromogenes TaxID=68214 RepID=A0ABS4LR56_9ACTN|nr:hypothetical protein [Streptomyces griseochromogenes]MBP2049881.1 hypothetical protein [Streptomyces griseochromogenes]
MYTDEQGLAWVRELVDRTAGFRSARIVKADVARTYPDSDLTTAEMYDFLAEQWAFEHPGQSSGEREAVELRVHLACSLRAWRAIRKEVIKTLCPEGMAPHTCRVPWFAA